MRAFGSEVIRVCIVASTDASAIEGGWGDFLRSYGPFDLRESRICIVESTDAGEVEGRSNRICTTESTEAGEVEGIILIIIWSFGSKVKSY